MHPHYRTPHISTEKCNSIAELLVSEALKKFRGITSPRELRCALVARAALVEQLMEHLDARHLPLRVHMRTYEL